VGRDAACGVCLDHPKVSRSHGVVTGCGAGWLYTDRDSRNGSWISNRPVSQRPLCTGDVITVGDSLLIFLRLEEPAGTGAAGHP